MNLYHIIYIGLGGFFGAISRFIVSKASYAFTTYFPLGTLCVNVLGSFILGFILYSMIFGKSALSQYRDFLAIGFLGSFTTMSTFSYETIRLFESQNFTSSIVNILLNIGLSLFAIICGKWAAITFFKF
ncbi:MAG: fluoride efflux transporter CrcB [Candidatus Latescibacteria bacterium]|nr:fluoride efflux transporter CrcB [Candidatus Latescibacterota bacterium]